MRVDVDRSVRPEGALLPEAFRLDRKVVLVTGAGSARGIDRAIGIAYAAAGAAVSFADLDAGARSRPHVR